MTSSLPTTFTPNKIYRLEEIVLSYNPANTYIFKHLESGLIYDSRELGPDWVFLEYKPLPIFLNEGKKYHFHYEIRSYRPGINRSNA